MLISQRSLYHYIHMMLPVYSYTYIAMFVYFNVEITARSRIRELHVPALKVHVRNHIYIICIYIQTSRRYPVPFQILFFRFSFSLRG